MSDDTLKSKINIFRSIDELIFNLIDQIQESQPYLELVDRLDSLDADIKSLLAKIGSLILIAIPFMICGGFYLYNTSLSSRIQQMDSSRKQADEYIIKASKFAGATRSILGPSTYQSGNDMLSAIRDQAQAINVDGSALKVANFNQNDIVSGIVQTNATLQFTGLNLENLSNLFERLTTRSRYKFDGLLIKKNSKNGTLEGKVEVIYFSKSVEQS